MFAAAVRDRGRCEGGQRRRRRAARKAASAGPSGRLAPSSDLSAMPIPFGPPAQRRPSAPPFANQPAAARIRWKSAPSGPPTRSGCARIALAIRLSLGQLLEAREGVGHALERERERDDAAAVGRGRELCLVGFDCLGVGGGARLLDRDARAGGSRSWASRARGRARACRRACRSSCGRSSAAAAPPGGRARGRPRLRAPSRAARARRRSDRRVARCEAEAIARSRSSRSARARASGSAWIGFDDERMKQVSPASPASAITAPSCTATACTRCRASTMPLRRTSTMSGSIGGGAYACERWLVPTRPVPGTVTDVSQLPKRHWRRAIPLLHLRLDATAAARHAGRHLSCLHALRLGGASAVSRRPRPSRFLRELARVTRTFEWTCIGFCLMGTHYHLILEVADKALPVGMQSLNFRYAVDFNQRHGMRGHVQFARYGAVRIDRRLASSDCVSSTSHGTRSKHASAAAARTGPGAATRDRRLAEPHSFVDPTASPRVLRSRAGAGRRAAPGVRRGAVTKTLRCLAPDVSWRSACQRAGKVVHFGKMARSATKASGEAGRARLACRAGLRGSRRAARAGAGAAAGARRRSCARGSSSCSASTRTRSPSSRSWLGLPKGTVGHHVKVLEKAGLVQVVRTRRCARSPSGTTGAPRGSSSSRAPTMQAAKTSGIVAAASLRTAAEEMLPPDDDDRTTFAVLRMRLTDADARASRAGSRSSSATSWPRTIPTASPTGSSPRSTGERPMRRLRRPTGGLWDNARLHQALGRPVDQRARLAGLAARDPVVAAIALHASPFVFSLLAVLRLSAVHPLRAPRGRVGRPPAPAPDPDRRRRVPRASCSRRSRSSGRRRAHDLAAARPPVRRRHLHRLLRRRVPVVSPPARRPRPSDRRQLEAPAHRLGRAGRRAEHGRRADRRAHRAVRDPRRRRQLRRLDRLPAPDPNGRAAAASAPREPRSRACGPR